MWHVFTCPFVAYVAVNKMPDTVKLCCTKVNASSLIPNVKLVRLLMSIHRHSSKPAGGSVQGGVRSVPYSHHSLDETVKWFPLIKGNGVYSRRTVIVESLVVPYRFAVTGSCPPPGRYSLDTFRPKA